MLGAGETAGRLAERASVVESCASLGMPSSVPSAIAEPGQQPLIAVRVRRGGSEQLLIRRAQDELSAFIGTLDQLAEEGAECHLLNGLKHLLRYEIYEAAFALFDWIHAAVGVDRTSILLFEPDDRQTGTYPVYDLCATGVVNPSDRAAMLMASFDAYESNSNNDTSRWWFLEAFAFALSRYCGMTGAYDVGLNYVDRAHRLVDCTRAPGSRSLYLEACRHALELRRSGAAVPPRLEKFVGYDTGVLNDVVCGLPYRHFEVNASGGVYVCCPHLVPTPIGEIASESAEAIWNSERAKRMRDSVVDGSFRFCDHINCSHLIHNSLPRKDSAEIQSDPVLRAAVEDGVREVEPIQFLSFGYDDSCNLSCPSCRRELRMQKWDGDVIGSVEDKVAALLPRVKMLYMNPCGEFLVSKPSRRILQAIDPETCQDLRLMIISNGTLFSESEYEKFRNIHGKLAVVRISTDAASRDTFETIRRGGTWDRFVENMHFLARLRAEGEIGYFLLSFTYQLGNFREMKDFVRFCESLGADQARFEKLLMTSSAMTEQEYEERAVHRPGHPLYQEFIDTIADPIFKQPNVYGDFEMA